MTMTALTMTVGLLLVMLGVGGYAGSGAASVTALIPAAFGSVFLLLGWFGRRESWRRHCMHAAAVLSLIGFGATAGGIGRTLTLLSGGETARPAASAVQAIMALLCAVYLVFAVRSFILARRKGGAGT